MYLLNDVLSLLWKNDFDPNHSLTKLLPDYDFAPLNGDSSNCKRTGVPRFFLRSLSSIDAHSCSRIDARPAMDLIPFHTNPISSEDVKFRIPRLKTLSLIEKCKRLRQSITTGTFTQPIKSGHLSVAEKQTKRQNSNSNSDVHTLKSNNGISRICSTKLKMSASKNSATKRCLSLSSPSKISPPNLPIGGVFRPDQSLSCALQDTSEIPNLESTPNSMQFKTDFIAPFYEFRELLGGGRFGKVFRCVDKKSSKDFAAKCLRCKKPIFPHQPANTNPNRDVIDDYEIEPMKKEDVIMEIAIMQQLNHPNIVKLYDVFENGDSITIIMEYLGGGELFERVISDRSQLTEADARIYTLQIVQAVQYLHKNFILHLDLKPENIVCTNRSSHHVKIIDFGLARRFIPNKKLHVQWGTPEFMAPETLESSIATTASDMWSIGVITYILLSGYSPFFGEDVNGTIKQVIRGQWNFHVFEFELVSNEAKDFISKLLVKNDSDRLSATECLRHPWLTALSTDKEKNKSKSINIFKANYSIFNLVNWLKQRVQDVQKKLPFSDLIEFQFEENDTIPAPSA